MAKLTCGVRRFSPSRPVAVIARITRSQNSSPCAKPASLLKDLRIVIMHDTFRGEDHAVAAARLDGHWLTLDNRRMAMVEDAYVRNYRPLFVIDRYGVMQYADPPLAASLRGPDLPPSAALDPVAEPTQLSTAD